MSKFQVEVTLEAVTCTCGIQFAAPTHLLTQLREKHTTFYCPRGCRQHFPGESDTERLERELKQAKMRETSQRSRANALSRRNTALKGHHTRLKKRIGNGECPCCRRNFQNLQRHMKSQHPDYTEVDNG